jgi:hypothetical protein
METQAQSIDQFVHSAYEKFIEITNRLAGEGFSDKTHSEVEAYLECDGRELLRLLLQEHLDTRGSGRVGETVCGADGIVRTHKRDYMPKGYQSVFGKVGVERTGYSRRGAGNLFPLDAQLNLPAQGYSHRLQKRVSVKAAKESFEEVSKDIEEETGVRIGKHQVEQIVGNAAQDFEAFYTRATPEELQQQVQGQPIQVLTFDGKGVVMRPEGLREGTRKKAEASPPKPPRGFSRQDNSNHKRMATVAGVYHVGRHVRSPKTVARQFAPLRLVPNNRSPSPKPVAKTLWASLEKPMKAVIEAGFEEALRRDPEHRAEWVVLVDGDPKQLGYIEKAAQHHQVNVCVILDIIHVLDYLWKAANALFDAEDTQAPEWVAEQIERVLQGKARSVVRRLRRAATTNGLSGKQREPLDQCLTYLVNHFPYLNYPHYLARGYPIATGVIEGACRYLVKDRMEITGARWGLPGGEAILKLRALYLNGDFDAYWDFHEQQEYQRNHAAKFSHTPQVRPQLQLLPGGKS